MENNASLLFPFSNNSVQWTEGGAVTPSSYDWHGYLDGEQTQQFMASVPSTSHTALVSSPPMVFSDILETQMEKQKQELEIYLHIQNEQLIAAIHQQMIQQASLINLMQSNASTCLRQKEDELENAQRRAAELEELLSRAQKQKELWQKVANLREATVAALHDTLQRVQDPCRSSTTAAEEEEGESRLMGRGLPLCKLCSSRQSCMLLIPCQHVCTCENCTAPLHVCPICGTMKKDSLEILFS